MLLRSILFMFGLITKFSGKQDPTFKFSNLNNNEILKCAVIILIAYSLFMGLLYQLYKTQRSNK